MQFKNTIFNIYVSICLYTPRATKGVKKVFSEEASLLAAFTFFAIDDSRDRSHPETITTGKKTGMIAESCGTIAEKAGEA